MPRRLAVLFVVAALVAPETTLTSQNAPKRLPIIAGAMGMNILVNPDGSVQSWGEPDGEAAGLGDGTNNSRTMPAPIPGVNGIVDASVGFGHVLLLKSDGTVLAWGRNNGCELGVKDDNKRLAPIVVPGVTGAIHVAAARVFSAAVLRDGTVRVWGNNEHGMLANGKSGFNDDCTWTPTLVQGLSGVVQIAMNDGTIIVRKSDGTVWGWGDNSGGVLCDGTEMDRTRPVQMKGINNAVDIDISAQSVVVLADGTVRMCGFSGDGSMADAPAGVHSTPWKIGGVTNAVTARGAGVTIVRLKDGTLVGWGYGMHGSLGDGFIDKIDPKPRSPIGLGPVLAHWFASNGGYAVRADGTIMQWGTFIARPNTWSLKPIPFVKVVMP